MKWRKCGIVFPFALVLLLGTRSLSVHSVELWDDQWVLEEEEDLEWVSEEEGIEEPKGLAGEVGIEGEEGEEKEEEEEIPIPGDEAFLQAARESMGLLEGEVLTAEKAGKVTSLFLSGKGLCSLSGIEYFPELSMLFADANLLGEVDLHANSKLTYLNLGGNALTELDLSGNPLLSILYVRENALTHITLGNPAALAELDLVDNPMTDLDLEGVSSLVRLDFGRVPLQRLRLCGALKLDSLDLSVLHELKSLCIMHNPELLYLTYTGVEDLQEVYIEGNEKLLEVWLYDHPFLESLVVLDNPSLRLIDVHGDGLSSLDLGTNRALVRADVSGNRLEKLILPEGANWEELHYGGNFLTRESLQGLEADFVANPQRTLEVVTLGKVKRSKVKNEKKGIWVSWEGVPGGREYVLYRKQVGSSEKAVALVTLGQEAPSGSFSLAGEGDLGRYSYLDETAESLGSYKYYVKVKPYQEGRVSFTSEGKSKPGFIIRLSQPVALKVKGGKGKVKYSWKQKEKVDGYELCFSQSLPASKGDRKVITLGESIEGREMSSGESIEGNGISPGESIAGSIKLSEGRWYFTYRSFVWAEGRKIYSPYSKRKSCEVRSVFVS